MQIVLVAMIVHTFLMIEIGIFVVLGRPRMKVTKILMLLALMLMLGPMLRADSTPVTMVFTGVNGSNDGHYYVSPYTGTMNGQTVTLFCVDMINDVNFGQSWQANVTSLASGNLSNTRYGNSTISPVAADAAVLYAEAEKRPALARSYGCELRFHQPQPIRHHHECRTGDAHRPGPGIHHSHP